MIELQHAIEARFPHWFAGSRARFARPLVRSLSKLSHLDTIGAFRREHGHLRGLALVDAALAWLDCRWQVDQVERERIPESGRVVIVANHPLGARDALAVLGLVGSVRRDVRILANDFLLAIDGLADLLIPLRILGGKPGADSLRLVDAALEHDEAVIVFPAGEVSRLTPLGVRDAEWRHGFVRFAEKAAAPVLPMRIEARNSALFYGASALFKPLGTGLLPREALQPRAHRITIRVGAPRRLDEVAGGNDRQHASREVRRAVYALGRRSDRWHPREAPLVHRPSPVAMRADLDRLALLGETADGKRIHGGRLPADSALLREIGRLRELTFRKVGEGTGKRVDLDAYDSWYDHIVLWDAEAGGVAGAYRAAACARVLDAHGLRGLYTASLFRFDGRLLPTIERGVELGRSFVTPAYWGSRSLDYLWYGIGAWLRNHADIRYLFGPVSISANLPLEAREWIVAYYTRYYGHPRTLARSPHPFSARGTPPDFGDLDAAAAQRVLRGRLDALGCSVPVLYKQYTELCEPGGTQFLSFGVDPAFNHAIDGLILVDIARIKARKRERYLGAGMRNASPGQAIA
ncbi:MAG: lysophospholipid acyltransferase family protein [Xanthomonadales bacterium]|nr:lysophospholipid acyltransferase family protein [Xanthomonadales bacterium]